MDDPTDKENAPYCKKLTKRLNPASPISAVSPSCRPSSRRKMQRQFLEGDDNLEATFLESTLNQSKLTDVSFRKNRFSMSNDGNERIDNKISAENDTTLRNQHQVLEGDGNLEATYLETTLNQSKLPDVSFHKDRFSMSFSEAKGCNESIDNESSAGNDTTLGNQPVLEGDGNLEATYLESTLNQSKLPDYSFDNKRFSTSNVDNESIGNISSTEDDTTLENVNCSRETFVQEENDKSCFSSFSLKTSEKDVSFPINRFSISNDCNEYVDNGISAENDMPLRNQHQVLEGDGNLEATYLETTLNQSKLPDVSFRKNRLSMSFSEVNDNKSIDNESWAENDTTLGNQQQVLEGDGNSEATYLESTLNQSKLPEYSFDNKRFSTCNVHNESVGNISSTENDTTLEDMNCSRETIVEDANNKSFVSSFSQKPSEKEPSLTADTNISEENTILTQEDHMVCTVKDVNQVEAVDTQSDDDFKSSKADMTSSQDSATLSQDAVTSSQYAVSSSQYAVTSPADITSSSADHVKEDVKIDHVGSSFSGLSLADELGAVGIQITEQNMGLVVYATEERKDVSERVDTTSRAAVAAEQVVLPAQPAEHELPAQPAEHALSAPPAEHVLPAQPAEHVLSAQPAEDVLPAKQAGHVVLPVKKTIADKDVPFCPEALSPIQDNSLYDNSSKTECSRPRTPQKRFVFNPSDVTPTPATSGNQKYNFNDSHLSFILMENMLTVENDKQNEALIRNLEAKLKEAESEVEKLRTEVAENPKDKEELVNLRTLLDKEKSKVEFAKRDVEGYQLMLECAQKREKNVKQEMQQQIRKLEMSLEVLETEKASAGMNTALTGEIERLSEVVAVLENEKATLAQQVETERRGCESKEKAMVSAQKEVEDIRKDVQELQTQLDNVQMLLVTRDKEVEVLRSKVEDDEEKTIKLIEESCALSRQLKDAQLSSEEVIHGLKVEIERLTQQYIDEGSACEKEKERREMAEAAVEAVKLELAAAEQSDKCVTEFKEKIEMLTELCEKEKMAHETERTNRSAAEECLAAKEIEINNIRTELSTNQDKCDELNTRVVEYEQKITMLNQEYSELTSELSAAQQKNAVEVSALKEEIERISKKANTYQNEEKKLMEAEATLAEKELEMNGVRMELSENQGKVDELNTRVLEYEQNITKLHEECSAFSHQLSAAQQKHEDDVSALKEEIEGLSKCCEEKENAYQNEEKKRLQSEANLATKDVEINTVRMELSENQKKLGDLNTRLIEYEQKITKLNEECSEFSHELSAAQQKNEVEVSALKEEIEVLSKRCEEKENEEKMHLEAEAALTAKDLEINTVRMELSENQEKVGELNTRVLEYVQKIAKLDEECSTFSHQLSAAQQKNEDKVSALKEEIEDLLKRCEEKENAYQHEAMKHLESEAALATKDVEINTVRMELSENQKKLGDLNTRLLEYEQKITKLNEECSAFSHQLSADQQKNEDEVSALKEEMERLSKRCEEKGNACESEQKKRIEAETALAAMESKCSCQDSELKDKYDALVWENEHLLKTCDEMDDLEENFRLTIRRLEAEKKTLMDAQVTAATEGKPMPPTSGTDHEEIARLRAENEKLEKMVDDTEDLQFKLCAEIDVLKNQLNARRNAENPGLLAQLQKGVEPIDAQSSYLAAHTSKTSTSLDSPVQNFAASTTMPDHSIMAQNTTVHLGNATGLDMTNTSMTQAKTPKSAKKKGTKDPSQCSQQ